MTDRLTAALKVFGWEANEEFLRRYHTDAWVYNLANALASMCDLADRLAAELARHGWGDMHYSNKLEQEQQIVALLDEWRERGVLQWGPDHPDYDEMGQ